MHSLAMLYYHAVNAYWGAGITAFDLLSNKLFVEVFMDYVQPLPVIVNHTA